jgi:hypothetical protein
MNVKFIKSYSLLFLLGICLVGCEKATSPVEEEEQEEVIVEKPKLSFYEGTTIGTTYDITSLTVNSKSIETGWLKDCAPLRTYEPSATDKQSGTLVYNVQFKKIGLSGITSGQNSGNVSLSGMKNGCNEVELVAQGGTIVLVPRYQD